MPDLFALAMPWWEFILRAVVVYVVVLGMVRLSGKRPLGQITPFDVLLVVLLGNAVQNALLGTDTSLGGGLLLAATLILLNYGVGWVSTRSRRIERLVEGEPVVIARDGRLFDAVLRREQVTLADFEAAMRQQGRLGVEDVELALLEINGHITIIPRKST
nr:YetF domain-containing protein [Stenotrophomonas geniculata]